MKLRDQKTSSTSEDPKIKSALLNKYEEEDQKEIDGYERLKTKESNKQNIRFFVNKRILITRP